MESRHVIAEKQDVLQMLVASQQRADGQSAGLLHGDDREVAPMVRFQPIHEVDPREHVLAREPVDDLDAVVLECAVGLATREQGHVLPGLVQAQCQPPADRSGANHQGLHDPQLRGVPGDARTTAGMRRIVVSGPNWSSNGMQRNSCMPAQWARQRIRGMRVCRPARTTPRTTARHR
jgi:hypothetical protein